MSPAANANDPKVTGPPGHACVRNTNNPSAETTRHTTGSHEEPARRTIKAARRLPMNYAVVPKTASSGAPSLLPPITAWVQIAFTVS